MPIARGSEGHCVFVLREEEDKAVISYWNYILTRLSDRCAAVCIHLASMHLHRIGETESTSKLTILVTFWGKVLAEEESTKLQLLVSGALIDRRPALPQATDYQIIFKKGRFPRRSMDSFSSDDLPAICEPRNRHFTPSPGTGDSIGISGSQNDTATLGFYVMVDAKPMVLTVDHLIPAGVTDSTICHISEQDRHDAIAASIMKEIQEFQQTTPHSCNHCQNLDGRSYWEEFRRNSQICECCILLQRLKTKASEWNTSHTAHELASQYMRSGTRHKTTNGRSREMDWALFEVFEDNPHLTFCTGELLRCGHEAIQSKYRSRNFCCEN